MREWIIAMNAVMHVQSARLHISVKIPDGFPPQRGIYRQNSRLHVHVAVHAVDHYKTILGGIFDGFVWIFEEGREKNMRMCVRRKLRTICTNGEDCTAVLLRIVGGFDED